MTGNARYEVLDIVGRGGFGTVYRARLMGEEGFSREVALKVLNEERAGVPELLRRLKEEARVLGLVRHRAIVHVDGLVKLGGHWTVVMEFVEGVHLRDLCRAGAVPPRVALEIVAEVAAALDAAYRARRPDGEPLRLLHRDVKPTNVQVTSHGEVKVLDFGIAKREDGEQDLPEPLQMGTPGYMSPERLDWVDGPEGDVYSLGVVLWEIVMSRSFGRTSSHFARHAKITHAQIERFRACLVEDWGTGASLADQLSALLRGMLAYNPERRPTARQVERRAMDLRDAAQGERLRDYAERVVPGLLEERQRLLVEEEQGGGDEHLTGTVLLAPDSGGSLPPGLGESGFPTPPPRHDEGPTVLVTNPDLATESQLIDLDLGEDPAGSQVIEIRRGQRSEAEQRRDGRKPSSARARAKDVRFLPGPESRAVKPGSPGGGADPIEQQLPGGESTVQMSDEELAAVGDDLEEEGDEKELEDVVAYRADERAAHKVEGVRHGGALGMGSEVMEALGLSEDPGAGGFGAAVPEAFGAPPAWEPEEEERGYDLARRLAWGVALICAMAVGALLGADLLRPEVSEEPPWMAAAVRAQQEGSVRSAEPVLRSWGAKDGEQVAEAPAEPEPPEPEPAEPDEPPAAAPRDAAPAVVEAPAARVETPRAAPSPAPSRARAREEVVVQVEEEPEVIDTGGFAFDDELVAEPEPAPPPPEPTGARVSVTGDAQQVRLVGPSSHELPGTVPAGSYTIKATFAGMGEVTAGRVTVPSSGSVTLTCNGLFARCEKK